MTKVAWERKHDEILKVIPSARKETVVFNLSGKQYDDTQYGTDYEKPRGFARFLGWIYNLIPKVGPFRVLSFSVPTPEAERLFLDSVTSTREHFRESLDALRAANLHLVNADFDTGLPTAMGEYMLADETYDKLLDKLADRKFANISAGLRSNLAAYYGGVTSLPASTGPQRARLARLRQQLALLDAVPGPERRRYPGVSGCKEKGFDTESLPSHPGGGLSSDRRATLMNSASIADVLLDATQWPFAEDRR